MCSISAIRLWAGHCDHSKKKFETYVIRTLPNSESIFSKKIIAGPTGPATNIIRVPIPVRLSPLRSDPAHYPILLDVSYPISVG